MAKRWKEEYKVYKNVLDNFTLRNLFELESKNLFVTDELVPFSMGKEANIFYGKGSHGPVIVKIYRVQSADFTKMYDYIKFDPRFIALKKQRRKVILAWVQREYRNLMKAREAGVICPTPYQILHNVIVMESIGGEEPAPKIKDGKPADPEKFFESVISNIEKLYKAELVHGDLSKFNILNDDEHAVLIDFSQATTTHNQNALEYLERDIKNVCDFFNKNGLKKDARQIFVKMVRARAKEKSETDKRTLKKSKYS